MNDRAMTLLEGRRKQLGRAVGRPLTLPLAGDQTSLSESEREHLCSAARDLYLNELAWENITDEEQVEGEPLAELTFPGFLAYIQGLLLDTVMPDSLAPADPRPEIVQEIVDFLAQRVVELQDALGKPDGHTAHLERDLAVTDRLLDLVLLRLHGVDPTDAEGFRDAARAT